jgi:hypothetical protein
MNTSKAGSTRLVTVALAMSLAERACGQVSVLLADLSDAQAETVVTRRGTTGCIRGIQVRFSDNTQGYFRACGPTNLPVWKFVEGLPRFPYESVVSG